jgi:hypothetical protein
MPRTGSRDRGRGRHWRAAPSRRRHPPCRCRAPRRTMPPTSTARRRPGVWVVRSQQTAEPDFFRCFLRKPHEGTFPMMAAWAFEGPLSVLRAMGLNTRRHHHRPALWARWPFSRDPKPGSRAGNRACSSPFTGGALLPRIATIERPMLWGRSN